MRGSPWAVSGRRLHRRVVVASYLVSHRRVLPFFPIDMCTITADTAAIYNMHKKTRRGLMSGPPFAVRVEQHLVNSLSHFTFIELSLVLTAKGADLPSAPFGFFTHVVEPVPL